MDDAATQNGWWLASDGRWYPPAEHPDARALSALVAEPGARRSGPAGTVTDRGGRHAATATTATATATTATPATPPDAGWWLASDGRWYPPELHPDAGGDLVGDGYAIAEELLQETGVAGVSDPAPAHIPKRVVPDVPDDFVYSSPAASTRSRSAERLRPLLIGLAVLVLLVLLAFAVSHL